ncbi:phytoene desaturase family protein [Dawidia soli]|uniref:FAD-dependent oxidoreductase n=1 Tax=Dawidia soli TaxID=2782352 RepID=A0AAP2DFZ3_9BACT|nr:NAD(P)/FAD-dependent oxidoreductase [Dawidia soli]MBT1688632.1 FAD-dependent oxidoreductase [Dawidia soli]
MRSYARVMYDVVIVGGGIAGMSCALRLQAKGFSTVVLEAHGQLGGCAGFFTKHGFSFDVGATTLVDFQENGVGGLFCAEVGLELPPGEYIDYIAWLPDRQVTLYHDPCQWVQERAAKLGNSAAHQAFWKLSDKVSSVFWEASRRGIILPFAGLADVVRAVKCIGVSNLYLARYLNRSMLDVLKEFGLEHDSPLRGLLAMLIEDTLHTTLEEAPFINAALGITIRGSGLMRPVGGMRGYFNYIEAYYKKIGGTVKKGHTVTALQQRDQWEVATTKATFAARGAVVTLPLENLYALVPPSIRVKLDRYRAPGVDSYGGAIVVFLGVPEENVATHAIRHHQLLIDYDRPLGNGNNMFISISAPGDHASAPPGFRAVMLSTHCSIASWTDLPEGEYQAKKTAIASVLIGHATRVYPSLMLHHRVLEVGTPVTYQKYTRRHLGAVGGHKLSRKNANLHAIPHDIGVKHLALAGDATWPGLGTVAGVMVSKIVSDRLCQTLRR